MKFVTGNLLSADTQALVNTVNTVGVMGKGIALQFKELFPASYEQYAAACKKGDVKIGKMFVVNDGLKGEKIIIHFPTKTEWYKKSQYSFIEEGLNDLVNVIERYKIKSIAIPPLGCGNGGLKWEKVRATMEKYLGHLTGIDIHVYEPSKELKATLQKEAPKKNVELTPGRAMLLYALFKYERYGEAASVFAANKLAYFLQRNGEPLKLKFIPYIYGPYSNAVEKVLYAMNGKYLSGMEQMEVAPFEPLQLNYNLYPEIEVYINENLNPEQRERLDNLFVIINGFESTLSLEILASIDFLLSENASQDIDELLSKIQGWTDRKKYLIQKSHVESALRHLQKYKSSRPLN